MVRVLVADDRPVPQEGLCRLLDAEPDIEVIGQTGAGDDAIEFCCRNEPDVIVIDFSASDLQRLDVIRRMRRRTPMSRIVVLTTLAHRPFLTRVLRAGAYSMVSKTSPIAELLEAVRKAADDGRHISPEIMDHLLDELRSEATEAPESTLSARELEVLVAIAAGHDTKEVAASLHLSRSTVDAHRGRIKRKLGLRNASEMTRFAIRRGLIDAG